MKIKRYDRENAVKYATEWAYKRNPKYYNFEKIGGDCTSFISQCLYAGSNVMNYKKYIGWYYNSANDRTASWSGVEYLYNFLTTNKSVGPRGEEVINLKALEIGDLIQLKFNGLERFSHSLIIVDKKADLIEEIYISTHTEDAYYKKVSEYNFERIRFIHINNVGIY